MKERTEKVIFWFLSIPLILGLMYVLGIRYSAPVRFQLGDRPLYPYLNELGAFSWTHGVVPIAPDSSASISIEGAPFWSAIEGCSEIWINYKDGHRRRILKLFDAEPGSGMSLGWGWSHDSKAIFIGGRTSGFNCSREGQKEFKIVYLLAEDKIWNVVSK